MSVKRLEQDDIVISAESIGSTIWSTDTVALTSFSTSSAQVSATSGDYYINVYAATGSSAVNQFSISYGNLTGQGSSRYNTAVAGKSPSATVYGQFRSLLLGDEGSTFSFGGSSVTDRDQLYAISIERARFKEKLSPGSINLRLSDGSNILNLTDNSGEVSTVSYSDSGRVYEIISGSNGNSYSGSGYHSTYGAYGQLYPDVGIILLNPYALSASLNFTMNLSDTAENEYNSQQLYNLISKGGYFAANSEETVTSNYVFVRVRNGEFNYSSNPSYIDDAGDLYHTVMVNSPQTYITAVGLYNDDNDLLAVAKLSKPLLKDFSKEALLRIKLDY